MRKSLKGFAVIGLSVSVLLLAACNENAEDANVEGSDDSRVQAEETQVESIPAHADLNQDPVPLKMERDGTDVYIEMTSQITEIELDDGYTYKAWTFNGEAPGPLVVVNEGDTIHFSMENMDPSIPTAWTFMRCTLLLIRDLQM